MASKFTFRQFGQILRTALRELKNNDPLRMAAATAFFTTFALPAILIIFIQLFGLVLNPQTISDHLFEHMGAIVGESSVTQIRETLKGFRKLASYIFDKLNYARKIMFLVVPESAVASIGTI